MRNLLDEVLVCRRSCSVPSAHALCVDFVICTPVSSGSFCFQQEQIVRGVETGSPRKSFVPVNAPDIALYVLLYMRFEPCTGWRGGGGVQEPSQEMRRDFCKIHVQPRNAIMYHREDPLSCT